MDQSIPVMLTINGRSVSPTLIKSFFIGIRGGLKTDDQLVKAGTIVTIDIDPSWFGPPKSEEESLPEESVALESTPELRTVQAPQTIPPIPSSIPPLPDTQPLRTASVMPRSFVGKEELPLENDHLGVLKELRVMRKVEVFDTVPEYISSPREGGPQFTKPELVTLETKDYQIETWKDIEVLIGRLVQMEVAAQRKYSILVVHKMPSAINDSKTKNIRLTEKLYGYGTYTPVAV